MKRNIRLILSIVLIFAALGLFIYVNGFLIPTISASVAIFGIGASYLTTWMLTKNDDDND
jgi:membrane associated rhomboid family serine protease